MTNGSLPQELAAALHSEVQTIRSVTGGCICDAFACRLADGRTVFIKNGTVYLQVGAGIVADSLPEREQAECEAKAEGVFVALQRARELESR